MKSFSLKLEQLNSTTGRLGLWDIPFPASDAPAVADGEFPLDPLLNPQRPGDPTRADMLQYVQGDSNSYPGRFEAIGDTLRRLVEPSGVLDQWLALREAGTRTYLETGSAANEVEPKLADLPWEYLAKVEGGVVEDRYFADSDRILIRVHRGKTSQHETPLIKGLIVTGEPLDWEKNDFPTEDVGAVVREFQNCKHCAHVELLETPTLDELETRLDQLKPEILHFTGHGEPSEQTNLPSLRISAPGGPWWWDTTKVSDTFQKLERAERLPRLVVLNACETGQSSSDLYSVMRVIQRRGVAAVVGTQAAIRQEATEGFSRTFYQKLAAGKTVDVAVAEARVGLGRAENGDGWLRRDWGLYVLSVSMPPEELWKTLEPSVRAMGCATLKEFYREDGYTAPFVSLGTGKARREFLNNLCSSNCIVVKGPEGCGKTWLVQRSLRDAVSFGNQVQYVSVGSLGSHANFVDLLKAIREGDPQKQREGSHIHEPLDRQAFDSFYSFVDGLTHAQIANLSAEEIARVCSTFEKGLEEAAKLAPLAVVLDQFSLGKEPRVSFSPPEFKKDGVKDIWKHIANGQVKNVRLLIAVIADNSLHVDEHRDYGLESLGVTPIELSELPAREFSKLFFEFFRFNRTIAGKQRASVDLNIVRRFFELEFPESGWKASLFERIREGTSRY